MPVQKKGNEKSDPTDMQVEDAFIIKINGIIENHLLQESFGVTELSKILGRSRSQILRKIKALTGKVNHKLH